MRYNKHELFALASQTSQNFDREGVMILKERQDGFFRRTEGCTVRWFRLRGNLLFYLKGPEQWYEPMGVIVLGNHQITTQNQDENGHWPFQIGWDNGVCYRLATFHESERTLWLKAIQLAPYESITSKMAELKTRLNSIRPVIDIDTYRQQKGVVADMNEVPLCELALSCDNLLCDTHGKPPSPVVVIFVQHPKGQLVRYGSTEIVETCSNPCFSKTILFKASDGLTGDVMVRIAVCDVKERVSETTIPMGYTSISLSTIQEAQRLRVALQTRDNKTVGFVTINGWSLEPSYIGSSPTHGNDRNSIDIPQKMLCHRRSQSLPPRLGLKLKFPSYGTLIKQNFVNSHQVTYRFHSGLGGDITVHEVMAEAKLCFQMPIQLLDIFIQREKELLDQLLSVGEISSECQTRQLEFVSTHLSLLKHYSHSKRCLQAFNGWFKPSSRKDEPSLEFAPVNLHLQRMWVHNDTLNKTGFHDVITVGAFAAHAHRAERTGGLIRLVQQVKDINSTKAELSSMTSKLQTDYENIVAVKRYRDEISADMDRILMLVQAGQYPDVQTAVEGIKSKVKSVLALWDPTVVEESLSYIGWLQNVAEGSNNQPMSTVMRMTDQFNMFDTQMSSDCETFDASSSSSSKEASPMVDHPTLSSSVPDIKNNVTNNKPELHFHNDYFKSEREERSERSERSWNHSFRSVRSTGKPKLNEAQSLSFEAKCHGSFRFDFKSSASLEQVSYMNLVENINNKNDKTKKVESYKDWIPVPRANLDQAQRDDNLMFLKTVGVGVEDSLMSVIEAVDKILDQANMSGYVEEDFLKTQKVMESIKVSIDETSRWLRLSHAAMRLRCESPAWAREHAALQTRRDICFAQALTTVSTGLLCWLSSMPSEVVVKLLTYGLGPLCGFEGLLSLYSTEKAMWGDMVVAVEDLHTVVFTLTKVGHSNTAIPQVTGTRGALTVRLPVSDSLYGKFTSKEHLSFTITAIFFNVGINEKASLAEALGETTPQQHSNGDNLDRLNKYYHKFTKIFPPDPMEPVRASSRTKPLEEVMENLRIAVLKKVPKNTEVLHLAALATRLMNGIRFTSCKSAKDRTGMSVTLEQLSILASEYHLAEHEQKKALNIMRSVGCRRENANKNIGIKKYAFTKKQVMSLPEDYRPPTGIKSKVKSVLALWDPTVVEESLSYIGWLQNVAEGSNNQPMSTVMRMTDQFNMFDTQMSSDCETFDASSSSSSKEASPMVDHPTLSSSVPDIKNNVTNNKPELHFHNDYFKSEREERSERSERSWNHSFRSVRSTGKPKLNEAQSLSFEAKCHGSFRFDFKSSASLEQVSYMNLVENINNKNDKTKKVESYKDWIPVPRANLDQAQRDDNLMFLKTVGVGVEDSLMSVIEAVDKILDQANMSGYVEEDFLKTQKVMESIKVSIDETSRWLRLSHAAMRLRCESPAWAREHAALQTRRDICFAQALTTVSTGLLCWLSSMPSEVVVKLLTYGLGPLCGFEGLLSLYSTEKAMWGDMVVAVEDLHTVVFTLTKVGHSNTAIPQVTGTRGALTVRLPVSDSLYGKFTSKEHLSFTITAIFFNVGINEKASLAEALGETTPQQHSNGDNLDRLNKYYHKFTKIFPPDPMEPVRASSRTKPLEEVMENLRIAVLKKVPKNTEVLHLAALATRLMNGIRFTSCKSAKDRTGMSVTLEQLSILASEYHLAEHEQKKALNIMRSVGCRRENANKNIGIKKYAFTKKQVMSLPEDYRPPTGIKIKVKSVLALWDPTVVEESLSYIGWLKNVAEGSNNQPMSTVMRMTDQFNMFDTQMSSDCETFDASSSSSSKEASPMVDHPTLSSSVPDIKNNVTNNKPELHFHNDYFKSEREERSERSERSWNHSFRSVRSTGKPKLNEAQSLSFEAKRHGSFRFDFKSSASLEQVSYMNLVENINNKNDKTKKVESYKDWIPVPRANLDQAQRDDNLMFLKTVGVGVEDSLMSVIEAVDKILDQANMSGYVEEDFLKTQKVMESIKVSIDETSRWLRLSHAAMRLRCESPAWAREHAALQTRRDICFAQALTTVSTGLLCWLSSMPSEVVVKLLTYGLGPLCGFEGLLSLYSTEKAMWGDMVVAVEDLHTVVFTLTKVGHSNTAIPQVTGTRGALTVRLPVSDSLYGKFTSKEHLSFTITAIFFNVGINEKASLAEALGETTPQQHSNGDNLDRLNKYYHKFTKIFPPDPMEPVRASSRTKPLEEVMENLRIAVLKKVPKNTEVLHLAALATRLMNGIRFTSCKSAKDRTGMSVTLEQLSILASEYHLAEHEQKKALNIMRSVGCRRENANKNIGIKKYAFTKKQVMSLPEDYRPPTGTYGSTQT